MELETRVHDEVHEAVEAIVDVVSMACAVLASVALVDELGAFQQECWEIEVVREANHARALLKTRRAHAQRLRMGKFIPNQFYRG